MQTIDEQFRKFKIFVSLVLAVLVVAVAGLAWLVLSEQSSETRGVAIGEMPPGIPTAVEQNSEPIAAPDYAKAIAGDLLKERMLVGTVVSVAGTKLVVSAQLTDVAKLSSFDFSAGGALPTVTKEVTIRIAGAQGAGLTPGQGVIVSLDKSVYGSEPVSAVAISALPGTP